MLYPEKSISDGVEDIQTNAILGIYKLHKKVALFYQRMNMRADEIVDQTGRKIVGGIDNHIDIAKDLWMTKVSVH